MTTTGVWCCRRNNVGCVAPAQHTLTYADLTLISPLPSKKLLIYLNYIIDSDAFHLLPAYTHMNARIPPDINRANYTRDVLWYQVYQSLLISAQALRPLRPPRQVPRLTKPAPEKYFLRSRTATLAGRPSFVFNYNVDYLYMHMLSGALLQVVCYFAFHGSPDPRKAATDIVCKTRSFTEMGCCQYAHQVRIIQISFQFTTTILYITCLNREYGDGE